LLRFGPVADMDKDDLKMQEEHEASKLV